jgi:hypothetical protein
MKLYRAFIVSSLVPWLAVSCISGEDVTAPGTTSSAGNSSASGQGGAIAGNVGGTKTIAVATGGKSNGGLGGSKAAGSTVVDVGGTQGVNVGGQTSTSPSTGAGGITATGGTPSTAAPPTGNLGVYLAQSGAITGSQSLTIHVDLVNTSGATHDLSTVTMRYWYVDDGWGSVQLTLATDYVSIGYSNTGTVTYVGSFAVSPAQTGADHYLEFSFTGNLAAANDVNSNDKFHVQVTLHAPGYAGSANVANDYSAMATAGYDDRITLYSSGTLIWGTEPGGATVTGSGGASGIGGSGATGGATSLSNSTAAGGTVNTGGESNTGGSVSGTGGVVSAGGVGGFGGDSGTGGVAPNGGDSGIGGDAGTDWDASAGGDTSIGGSSGTGST